MIFFVLLGSASKYFNRKLTRQFAERRLQRERLSGRVSYMREYKANKQKVI